MAQTVKPNSAKALFVLGSLYPEVTGGMEIFNYYFLKYQLTGLHKKNYYWTTKAVPGLESLHLKIRNLRPVRFFYPVQLFFVLLRYRSRVKYVYTGYARQSWALPFTYALIFRLFRIPYIVTIHSGGMPTWKFKYPYVYYFKNAYALVGVSESICEDYGNLAGGKEVLYIPPLIPFQRSEKSKAMSKHEFGLSEDDRVLLYVGSLKQMKNPDKVLKAFESLGNKFLESNKLKLVFVGGGEMLEELKNFAKEHAGLSDHVVFAGLVSRELIPDFFAMADYYIISSDYEGTSVSLLEAMYNKLAIIGADSPGINTMLQANQNALLYPVHDTKELANCIRSFVTDSRLADGLAAKANKDFGEKYSYQSMIEKYENLFNNFIL